MAPSISPSLYALLIFSFVELISITTSTPPSMPCSKTPAQGFEARLIHVNSPESPFYNPAAPMPTRADRIKKDRARLVGLRNNLNRLKARRAQRLSITAPIDQGHGEYFMIYKIGTPSVDTFGVFDTASPLLWLQCKPCERCYNQSVSIYDPANSNSYQKVICGHSSACNTVSDAKCAGSNGECRYQINSSKERSSSEGEIATETIMIGDSNLTNMIFGCGHNNVATVAGGHQHPPGVLGFSRESSSLVGQALIKYFSYCISSETNSAYSHVKIGYPAVITWGDTQTPLLSGKNGLYYLSLEGISVGGTKLNIPSHVFNMTQHGDQVGIFMDSATMYTMLAYEAFDELKTPITNALSGFHSVTDFDGIFTVCYDDRHFQLDQTPEVVFHFTDLDFPLTPNNTWTTNSQGHYCLAMLPNFEGPSIFGLYQHRNVNVGYDLFDNVVSFKYTSFCKHW